MQIFGTIVTDTSGPSYWTALDRNGLWPARLCAQLSLYGQIWMGLGPIWIHMTFLGLLFSDFFLGLVIFIIIKPILIVNCYNNRS